MSFANPWGLLALLSLPTIVAIHLFHRRFPPLVVAGLHLWGVESEVRTAGRRRDRVPITATLLLELLAALLLSMLLSEPRFGEMGRATHLVVVLDNSASMQAGPPGGPSFREAAIAELERRAEGLSRGSRITIILTGRQPTTLAGPEAFWKDAQSALEQWQPNMMRHGFEAAWDEAAQLAEQSGGSLLFLTDRLPDPLAPVPIQMEVVAMGRPLENIAISTARWTFDSTSGRGHLFLRINNLGPRPADVSVKGRGGNRTIFNQSVSVAPGASVLLESEVAGGLGRLTIEADSPTDGLKLDNHVTLVEPKVRMLTLAVTLPADDVARPLVERVLSGAKDIQIGEPKAAQLIIGPAGELPESRSELWWLGIGPIDRSEEAVKKAKVLPHQFPYLIEKRNPLLKGVLLGGVIWAGIQPVELDVSPLISAGGHPLLVSLNGTRSTAYLLNIDFSRSNLSESPDWPILLKNLIDLRRAILPGLRRWNYRLGEVARFQQADDKGSTQSDDAWLLAGPIKTRPLPVDGHGDVEIAPRDGPGIYEVRRGKQVVDRFAVNYFDSEESTLTSLNTGIRKPSFDETETDLSIDNPYSWVILLGLGMVACAIIADWRVLGSKEKG